MAGVYGNHERTCISAKDKVTYIACLPTFAVVEKHPVKDAIFRFTKRFQYFREQLPKEVIVGGLFKPKFSDIMQIDGKFVYRSAR